MADVAAYYEQLGKGASAAPATAAEPPASVAKLLAQANCASCHGANFSARRSIPRTPKLAGQHADYLYAALKAYQTDHNPSRGPQQRDHDGHGAAVHAPRDQGDRGLPRLAAGRAQDRPAAALPLARRLKRQLLASCRARARRALRRRCRRADPALGQPGRPADHGPALAERVHDQHDERPGLRAAHQPRPAAEDRSRPRHRVAAGVARWSGASSCGPGVKFHDGSPFSADDVVFSVQRGQQPTSQINNYAAGVGTPKKIDDLTVEFTLTAVNPIFLEHLDTLWIMSKAWSEKNKVDEAARLQEQGRELRLAERQRHRPVHAGQPRARHQDGLQAQPELLGQDRRQRPGHRLHADRQRRDAPGGAGLGRDRFRPRPGAARHRQAAQHAGREGDRRARRTGSSSSAWTRAATSCSTAASRARTRSRTSASAQALYQAIDIETLKTKLMNGQSFPTGGDDAVAARHLQRPGAREALSVRPRRRPQEPRRRRLRRRLRGPAPLPEQPLRQRRADLHRAGEHVGAGQGQGQGRRRAARDLLPAPREVRLQHVHARLGRRGRPTPRRCSRR